MKQFLVVVLDLATKIFVFALVFILLKKAQILFNQNIPNEHYNYFVIFVATAVATQSGMSIE